MFNSPEMRTKILTIQHCKGTRDSYRIPISANRPFRSREKFLPDHIENDGSCFEQIVKMDLDDTVCRLIAPQQTRYRIGQREESALQPCLKDAIASVETIV